MNRSCSHLLGAKPEGHITFMDMRDSGNWKQNLRLILRLMLAWGFALALILRVTPVFAANNPVLASPPQQDAFAVYHADLERAANQAIARDEARAPLDSGQPNASVTPDRTSKFDSRAVERFALRYWGNKDGDLRAALARLRQLQPVLAPILRGEHIPPELVAVVLVESAGRPSALSPRGALGLWQLIPETARRYGLRVESGRDERLDTQKATRAAARYLRDLHERFADWQLALAAYNAGGDRVASAIDRAGRADFSILSARHLLPAETRNYVPAVVAAATMITGRDALFRPASANMPQANTTNVYAEAGGDQ